MKNVLRHITPDFHCIEVPFRVIDKTYSEKFSEEYLWCEPLNEQPNCAKVVSIPYTLYGINPNDKITYKQLNGRIVFGSLVEDGGTYTYRIAIADSEDHKKHVENKKR